MGHVTKLPAMMFVVGASGAGKTTALRVLDARRLPGVVCYHFDSIGVPTPEVMQQQWGGGEGWQEAMTSQWIERMAESSGTAVAVLEGQTRPSFIEPRAALLGVRRRIVLLDCDARTRGERLNGPRGQPELNTSQMDSWAAYLRGQADALGLAVVNTSDRSVEDVADVLEQHVRALREGTG